VATCWVTSCEPARPPEGRTPALGGEARSAGGALVNTDRRLAFARARWPVAVAMRVVAEALAALATAPGMRRSVFIGPRTMRRVAVRDTTTPKALQPARGYEDLH